MFRENYKHMADQVRPSDELVRGLLESARSGGKRKTVQLFYKLTAAAAAVCICVFLAVPALAATSEPVYRLMYQVSPGMAQFFMPVQKSSEDNGIKMEVVSAYIHGSTADITVTMRDLTGNRVDGTSDLNDSYSINRSFGGVCTCRRVGYDEKTKTATFLISITGWGNQTITGDKITFSVNELISDKKDYKDVPVPIDLSSVTAAKDTKKISSTGGSGADYEKYVGSGETTALAPSRAMDGFPVKGLELTGVGYVDGRLHVQTAAHDNLNLDNHGYFYLKNAEGGMVSLDYDFHFLNQLQQPGRIDYYECVFDVPQEEIKNYALYGNFTVSGKHTEGSWRVTFPLEQAE